MEKLPTCNHHIPFGVQAYNSGKAGERLRRRTCLVGMRIVISGQTFSVGPSAGMGLGLERISEYGFTCVFVEDEQIVGHELMEVKHGADRIRDRIERSLPDPLTAEPIVLDEAND